MNAEHEHVSVNLPPPPYYTHSTADTWHPTLVPKNSGSATCIMYYYKFPIGVASLHNVFTVVIEMIGT